MVQVQLQLVEVAELVEIFGMKSQVDLLVPRKIFLESRKMVGGREESLAVLEDSEEIINSSN